MKIVIFCGGFGTRMWPISRKRLPKQFYPILNGKSFFELTYQRFRKKFDASDIYVSTEILYQELVKKQAPDLPAENILVEPERRDTAAAIGLVTYHLHMKYPDEVVFFSWSDHIIKNEEKFLNLVEFVSKYCAKSGKPVSLDQTPTFASTQNGWIELADFVEEIDGVKVSKIARQIEKPNLENAVSFLNSGKHLIHTGYGAWKISTMVEMFANYAPQIDSVLREIFDEFNTGSFVEVLNEKYKNIQKISIDYALFEKIPSGDRLSVSDDFGWADAGTWQLLFDSLSNDNQSLALSDVKLVELEGASNLVYSSTEGKNISIIGLSKIMVVETSDSILVAPLERSGDIKELYHLLEAKYPDIVD